MKLQKRLSEAHKMEAIGRMAGGIAHDMNNFLAIVMFGADAVKRNAPSSVEVEQGDGHVSFESRPGEGTEFQICLPLDPATIDSVPSQPGFELVGWIHKNQPGLQILLISGHPDPGERVAAKEIDVPILKKPFSPVELASRVRGILDEVKSTSAAGNS